ncbi:MAG: hypothetical protein A2X64_07690 [Ignavibacteria bacterium GWF2_33_9]|nr:MAG: hypothetical protein A2X64_07690 [Ignavibacteria bacterium GWF2_33_9]
MVAMGKKNIILHVGLPKTGTTFIQERVFPFLEDTYLLFGGIHLKGTPFEKYGIKVWKNSIHSLNPSVYTKEIETAKNWTHSLKEKNFILSAEGINGIDCSDKSIERIKLFGDLLGENAKVFLVVRKQDFWLQSMYNQQIIKDKIKLFVKINQYVGWKSSSYNTNGEINVYDLDWKKIALAYYKYFGKDNVLVMPYEFFKENPEEFLKRFFEFSGIKPFYLENYEYINKKAKEIQRITLLHFYYKFLSLIKNKTIIEKIFKNDKGLRNLLDSIGLNINYKNEYLCENQRNILMNIHKESNKELEHVIGFNLKQYGYY